jgi:hypothetical protein
MATRFIQNYVNELINEQVAAENPFAGSAPVDNRKRKKFPGRVEGDRPGGLTDADLDQMGPEYGEAQPEPQPEPNRPGEMVGSPGLGGTERDEDEIRGGLQPEAPPPGSVDTSPTPIATPTPPAPPADPAPPIGRPKPYPPIGRPKPFPPSVPKPMPAPQPEPDAPAPQPAPVPQPEPGAPAPTPREVRTGQVNIDNTGTVVGTQGVGNQVGNITTGDVTTNTTPAAPAAPASTTPEQRKQEPLPAEVKNAAAANPSQSAEIINNYYNYGTIVGAMGAGNRVGSITTGGVATGAKARAGGATRTAGTATQPATGAQVSGGVLAGGDVAGKSGVEAAIRRRRQPITSSVDPALLRLNSILEQIAQEEEKRRGRVRTGDVNIDNTGTVVGAQGVGNQVGNITTGDISTGSALTPREKRREGQGQPTQYPDQQEPPKQEAPERKPPAQEPPESKPAPPDFLLRPEDDYMPPGRRPGPGPGYPSRPLPGKPEPLPGPGYPIQPKPIRPGKPIYPDGINPIRPLPTPPYDFLNRGPFTDHQIPRGRPSLQPDHERMRNEPEHIMRYR